MDTLKTLLILIIGGIILGWITIILLPIIGMLGEGIAGAPEKRTKLRLSIGIWIGALFQSYFYFSYIVLVISWVHTRINPESWTKFIIWTISFLVCLVPVFLGSAQAKNHHNAKRTGNYSALTESMRITAIFSIIAFFVFMFNRDVMNILWWWVPYV